jgi:predicted TIM-barrel fold metal-dependent hydrolase
MTTTISGYDLTPSAPVEVNAANEWRLKTPGGSDTWDRSPYPDAAKKMYMISCDTHLAPPTKLFAERIDERFKSRLARVEVDGDGVKWVVGLDNGRRERIHEVPVEGEDKYRTVAGGWRSTQGTVVDDTTIRLRISDQLADGIDGELIFPNGAGQFVFGTTDPEFTLALSQIYNDWCWELCGPYKDFCNPAAAIPTISVENAVSEIQRVAKMGYRVLTLPCKPVFGASDVSHINYNLPVFDPMWAAIEEADLAFTFHVSTGRDPRTSRGNGGAVINYVIHSLLPTVEPMANLCASGVLDRFPRLRFALIEAGVGWIPWAMDAMDEAYTKHHFWSRPKLKHGLPSDYFRASGASTFGEDVSGLALIEQYNLQNNALWANDYPHHEGTWPHSAQAIERQMGSLSDATRAKLVGLNAARLFKFDLPEKYKA